MRLSTARHEVVLDKPEPILSKDLPAYEVSPGWLITPRSYLLDRFTPSCEQIFLPTRRVKGGKVEFRAGNIEARIMRTRKLRRLKQRILPEQRREEDGVLIDLRRSAPGNWSHFLADHLPLTFFLVDNLKISPSQLKILLPKKIPAHIRQAAEIFGLCSVCTNDIVVGEGISYDVSQANGMRSVRHEWVQKRWVQERLARAMERNSPGQDLPKRVFISRRDTRRLRNEDEVADHLSRLGFRKIYIEDLPVIDQFRVFNEAECIVAIHGAGLAPLLYRNSQSKKSEIIELFPPGITNLVWRVAAAQVNCNWIGVRGHIEVQHVKHMYDLKRSFLKFSWEDFTIDVASIDLALDILNRPSYQEKPDRAE